MFTYSVCVVIYAGFPLTYLGAYQNAYENATQGCYQGNGTVCCLESNLTYSVAHNGPIYSAYSIGLGSESFKVSVMVTKGNNLSVAVVVDPTTSNTQSVPGLSSSATIQNRGSIENREIQDRILLVDSSNRLDEGEL
jgi:hypothetical protein